MSTDGPPLTPEEIRFIEQHGGLRLPQGRRIEDVEREVRRRAEEEERSAYAESLSVPDAADRLGLTVDDLGDWIEQRRVVVRAFGDEARLPAWQFAGPALLPHLAEVLDALPPDARSETIAGFFTTPDSDLDGLTAAQWLTNGRDPERVLWLADTLQRW